ncbi:MAG: hypothetical protein AB1571_01545 [Nanoarchaeota archaeon]
MAEIHSKTYNSILDKMKRVDRVLNESRRNISKIEAFVDGARKVEPIFARHHLYFLIGKKISECLGDIVRYYPNK